MAVMRRAPFVIAGSVLAVCAAVAGLASAQPVEPSTPMVDGSFDCEFRPERVSCTRKTTTTTPATTTTTQPATTTTAAPTTTAPPATTTTAPVASTTTQPATTSTTSSPPSGSDFAVDFDTVADLELFDWGVHHRAAVGDSTVDHAEVFTGSHDMACSPPPTTRQVHTNTDHLAGASNEVFWYCAPNGPATGHVMLGLGSPSGYDTTGIRPKQTFTNIREVCIDTNLNTFANAYVLGRAWMEFRVIPADTYAQLNTVDAGWDHGPADVDWVIDAAVDDRAHVPGDTAGTDTVVSWTGPGGWSFWRDGVKRADTWETAGEWYADGEAARYTVCLKENTNGTMTISEERENSVVYSATGAGQFPDEPSVVQFEAHWYDQGKEGTSPSGTWHWDNITVDVE